MVSAAVLCIGLVTGAFGCAADAPEASPAGAIYGAVLAEVLAEQPVPATAAGVLPVLYVAPLDKRYPIELADQAEVLERLRPAADVRFVDDRAEAIDDKRPDRPVRDGAVLVELGPVQDEADGRHTVHLRRSDDALEPQERSAVVTRAEGTWAVELVAR